MTGASTCPAFSPDIPLSEADRESTRPVTRASRAPSRAALALSVGGGAAAPSRAPGAARAVSRAGQRPAHGAAASGTPRSRSSGSWWSSDPAGTTDGTRSSVDVLDTLPWPQRPPACPRPPSEGWRTRRAPARVGRNPGAAHAARGPSSGWVISAEQRRVNSRERRSGVDAEGD